MKGLNGKNMSGLAVRKFREKLRLTQLQLAAKLHTQHKWSMERDTITKIELGNRCVTDDELVMLAKTLGVTPNDLVNWK